MLFGRRRILMRVVLKPHPDTPSTAITGIEVKIARTAKAGLDLHYFVMGTIDDVRWPPLASAERLDRLWEQSCFEVFVGAAGRSGYHEFNLSPSSCWAAYRFSDYRAGMQIALVTSAPEIGSRITAKTYVLRATVPLANLHGLPEHVDWDIALSAVIEQRDGAKSYWALAHPPGKPDFHHKDCFALQLAPPVPA
jgi:hypothetical protein